MIAVCLLAGHPAAQEMPDDPLYASSGSWGQAHDDQWALKAIGFSDSAAPAWALARKATHPVIVAVIDTGIDLFHPDLAPERIWRNPGERLNGLDDDGNGYVDDLAGWNFAENNNDPTDHAGHGTHVAGVIAAKSGNGEGIAGINPAARIMPLKVLNIIGRGRSSRIAEAIFYAVRNGARVINLSLGGERLSPIERRAIDYARAKGVVVVAAAGNEGQRIDAYGPAGLDGVLTVVASVPGDAPAPFSNFGRAVDLAAPGVDVVSLRARHTDFTLLSFAGDYEAGTHIVGAGGRYYRASGTSFAAPFVAGVASLLLSVNPDLTGEQVARMLKYSARDIGYPGVDLRVGYGLLDARAALEADPAFFIEARITNVVLAKGGSGPALAVFGTAASDRLADAWLEIGEGDSPEQWKRVGSPIAASIEEGVLSTISAGEFRGSKHWIIRLTVRHAGGATRETRFKLNLG